MTNRQRQHAPGADVVLTDAQHYQSNGQKEQALDIINEYFSKPRTRNQLDKQHDDLIELAFQNSAELAIPTKNVIHFYIQKAPEYGSDKIGKRLEDYLTRCYNMIKEKQNILAQKGSVSVLLMSEDRYKVIVRSIVEPAVSFMFDALLTILVDLGRYNLRDEPFFFDLVKIGYMYCAEFHRCDYHRQLSARKGAPRMGAPRSIVASFVDIEIARYRTAVELGIYSEALQALNEANNLSPILDDVATKELIEKEKLELLKKAGYKLYAAIQMYNVLNFYRERPGMKTEEELEEMANLVLMEAAAAPLVEEENGYQDDDASNGRYGMLPEAEKRNTNVSHPGDDADCLRNGRTKDTRI